MISGPSADPSCPGETGWFWPGPTQELTMSPRPPFCSLSNNPPNPPRRPPAPSSEVGCDPVVVAALGPPPLNRAPEASRASRASISGLAMLPPGAAERNISSRPAIVYSLWFVVAIFVDALRAATPCDRIVDQQDNHRAHDCDDHAPYVQTRDARCAKQIKEK